MAGIGPAPGICQQRDCAAALARRESADLSSAQEPRVGIAAESAQFVYALLGADHYNSPHTQTGERIARIAGGGVRLVIDKLRSDITKTRKDGTRGRLRYDYGDHRDP